MPKYKWNRGEPIYPELDESLVARKVQLALSRLLVERMVDSTYIAPLGIALVAWIIGQASGLTHALIWTGLMLVTELLIVVVGNRFQRAQSRGEAGGSWVNAEIAASGLLGLAWGCAVWFAWAEGGFMLYVAIVCILVGVASICMVTMSPIRMAHTLFLVGILTPPLAYIALVPNPLAWQFSLGLLVMAAVHAWTSRDLNRELSREVKSSLRNKELLELLSKTSADLHQLNGLMKEKNAELSIAMDKLNETVTRDHLTGAYSRRYIFEQLERHAAIKLRHGSMAAVIMFDLDHFKSINDTYGHPVGDRGLQAVVSAVNAQLRDGDMLARVGGEEFLVLLPMTDLDAALILAERLRQTLAETVIVENGNAIHLPASFGVAKLIGGEGYSDWFRRTDTALYKAKAAGRNALVAAG